MKKIFFTIAVLLSLLPVSNGQNKVSNSSLLWKISGKDLKDTSYIFGTIHMICSKDFLWTDVMKNAFDNTRELYLELPMADEGFQQQMFEHIMLTDDQQLKDFFTDEDYQKLDIFFKDSIKVNLATLSKMKPFGVMSFVLLKHIDCNGNMPVAFEEKLKSFAKDKSMPVKGLETVEEQMKIFEDMPKDSLAKMVMASITDLPKSRKTFERMVNAYKNQDLIMLNREITKSLEYASHLDAMLYKRNERWIPTIITAAKEKPTFFAVGAGHLAGRKGVLALLKEKGYTVEPVK